nr:hypothetical protein [Cystobacter sp.]
MSSGGEQMFPPLIFMAFPMNRQEMRTKTCQAAPRPHKSLTWHQKDISMKASKCSHCPHDTSDELTSDI